LHVFSKQKYIVTMSVVVIFLEAKQKRNMRKVLTRDEFSVRRTHEKWSRRFGLVWPRTNIISTQCCPRKLEGNLGWRTRQLVCRMYSWTVYTRRLRTQTTTYGLADKIWLYLLLFIYKFRWQCENTIKNFQKRNVKRLWINFV
jgi:hypothetical protein